MGNYIYYKTWPLLFFLSFILISTVISCKKRSIKLDDDLQAITDSVPETVDPPTPPEDNAPPAEEEEEEEESILVGNGSGSLTINSSTLNGTSATTIRIRSGSYSVISIQNLTGTIDNPITIVNDGQVRVGEAIETRDINNVVISGAGNSTIPYGISFENLGYRAIRMSGKMSGVTIRNIYFKNVPDLCIAGDDSNGRGLANDGSVATRTERFKILHCVFDNVGTIGFGGELNRSGDTGFFKDVEIAYNTFKNSDAGNLCVFTNVQDYDIHHNVVDQVNPRNNNHNGIFFMQGNGKFHDNILTNYQGNAIRAWVFSRGTTPATLEIYNNICFNTSKYGAFEIQEFAHHLVSGKTTYLNAKVHNNTAGKMNTSRDWQGQVLDLYNISGALEYYNNLGFELYSSESNKPITDMINNMSSTRITRNTDNLYYTSQNAAITNAVSFVSRHSGVGATLDL